MDGTIGLEPSDQKNPDRKQDSSRAGNRGKPPGPPAYPTSNGNIIHTRSRRARDPRHDYDQRHKRPDTSVPETPAGPRGIMDEDLTRLPPGGRTIRPGGPAVRPTLDQVATPRWTSVPAVQSQVDQRFGQMEQRFDLDTGLTTPTAAGPDRNKLRDQGREEHPQHRPPADGTEKRQGRARNPPWTRTSSTSSRPRTTAVTWDEQCTLAVASS